MIKNFKWLLLVSLTFVACSSDEQDLSGVVPEVVPSAGTADFTRYVALGNSLTAGFSDGALFKAGQMNAYPKLLSEQFALVGGGNFTTPLMNDNAGGIIANGLPIQNVRLIFNGTSPIPLPGATPTTNLANILTGPFNNMGVPGAKSFHLLAPGYGNPAGVLSGASNPYFVRFASSSSAKIIDDAVAQNPTFFSLWIGNNDVLSFATSGGTGTNQTGNLDPTTYGGNDITDPNVFANTYSTIVDAMTANGAKGVVANIPYVSSAPFFTFVSPRTVPALPTANAAALNQLFGVINQITTAGSLPNRFETLTVDDGNPNTIEARNPVLIFDESLPNLSGSILAALEPTLGTATATFLANQYGRARHARTATGDRDFVLLTAGSTIGTNQSSVPAPYNVIGISFPMQDNRILTADEVQQINTATDAYNASIRSIADAKNLAFVDANLLLRQLSSGGIRFETYHMSSQFIQGGAFSLDGIHITPRGNAYIANKFLEAIRAKYGTVLPMKKMKDYPISYPPTLLN
jgi:hypothetical protein